MFEETLRKNLTIEKITQINATYKLRIVFSSGEHGVVDLADKVRTKESLSPLRDQGLFSKCAIVYENTTVGWPGDITIGWDTFYIYAKEQGMLSSGDVMTANELKAWLKISGIKQKDLAMKLGYTPAQVNRYATGRVKIPSIVRLSCLALQAGLG